jgi:hypothetical protein
MLPETEVLLRSKTVPLLPGVIVLIILDYLPTVELARLSNTTLWQEVLSQVLPQALDLEHLRAVGFGQEALIKIEDQSNAKLFVKCHEGGKYLNMIKFLTYLLALAISCGEISLILTDHWVDIVAEIIFCTSMGILAMLLCVGGFCFTHAEISDQATEIPFHDDEGSAHTFRFCGSGCKIT